MKKLLALMLVICLSFAAVLSANAAEDAYPSKPITIIVPWAAGGGGDTAARIIAKGIEKQLGATVVINNITGGSGLIGIGQMAQSAADGYTLGLLVSSGVDLYPFTTQVPYTIDDLEFIGNMVTRDGVITASKASGITNLDELKAKAENGTLTWGCVPSGQAYMCGYQLFKALGVLDKVTMIPYSGGAAEAAAAVLGGHIDVCTSILSDQMENIRAEQVTLLFNLGDERLAEYPDVPCAKELGIDAVFSTNSVGLIAPAGLPADVHEKLENAVAASMQDQEILDLYCNSGDASAINYRNSEAQKAALLESAQANYSVMSETGLAVISMEDSGIFPNK